MELVERAGQLAQLDLLLGDCLRGSGCAVLLEGPAGTGKTELVRALGAAARAAGATFRYAAASRAESTIPFGVLRQLCHGAEFPAVAAELMTQLPDDLALPAVSAGEGAGPADPRLARACHDIGQGLLELSGAAPLVLAVDDSHVADAPSRHGLLGLFRRLGSARILVVLTHDISATRPDPAFLGELLRQPHFSRLSLAPLSRTGVARLVAGQPDDALAGLGPRFFAASGGNLLLLRALIEDYRIAARPRPEGYGLALLGQLRRTGHDVLGTARALAVLGAGAAPSLLGQVTGAGQQAAAAALSTMTAAGWLDEGYFRHAIARAAVLDDLPAATGARLHARWAEVLHDEGRPALVVARHLLNGEAASSDWTAAILARAADQALAAGQLPMAAECLELAGQCAPRAAERAVIRARLLHLDWQTSATASERHLGPLTAAHRAGELDVRHGLGLVRNLLWHGRTDQAAEILRQVRGHAGRQPSAEPADLAAAERWLACCHPPLARPGRRGWPGPLDDLAMARIDPTLQSTAVLADALSRGRSAAAAGHAEHVLDDLRLARDSPWAEEAGLLALSVLMSAGRLATAAARCDALLADARSRRAGTLSALFTGVQAEIALRRGESAVASALARTALADLAPDSWGVAVGLPLGTLLQAAAQQGGLHAGAADLARRVPPAIFSSRYALSYLDARGRYRLAAGRGRAALTDFLACGKLMSEWHLDLTELTPWRAGAAEACLSLGDRAEAERLAAEQLACPSRGGRARAMSLRVLAAAITTPDGQVELLTEAHGLCEAGGDRYEQSRVLVDLARAYRALGESRRARVMLRRAQWLTDSCRRTGGPRQRGAGPAAHDPASAAMAPIALLTPSERRVASLAVRGHTNREIAAQLYITASTAEQHLTQIYRKLHVGGRDDLPTSLCS